MWSNWASDAKHSLRVLWKNPLFSLVAIGSLALGMGANLAIFQLLDQLILRALPVRAPKELVHLRPPGLYAGQVFGPDTVSYPLYVQLRDRNQSLSGLLAQFPTEFNLQAGSSSERVFGEYVSGNYFDVLGVTPNRGRLLTAADDRPGDPRHTVVLSHGFWLRAFAGDSSVVGRTLKLNAQPVTVAGVAPPGFTGATNGRASDVFVPIASRPALTPSLGTLDQPNQYWLRVVGRLRPGVSLARARTDLDTLMRPLLVADFLRVAPRIGERAQKEIDRGLTLKSSPQGLPGANEFFSEPLYFLFAVVSLVLLIACVNLANLLLARAVSRSKEIAIRRALGAQNSHLLRRSLVESLMLAFAGGAAGILLASFFTGFLVRFLPVDTITRTLRTQPDWRIYLYAFALVLLTGLLFGAAPMLHTASAKVGEKRSALRLRKGLVALQVALSLLLLFGAALFTRTLSNLRSVQVGYRTSQIVQFTVNPSANGYSQERSRAALEELRRRVASLPGVESAGVAGNRLLSGDEWQVTVSVPGYQPQTGENMNLRFNFVSPDYFRAVGIPVTAGREFTGVETETATKALILNQTAANRFFKGDAVGRKIAFGFKQDEPIEIVGVVPDHVTIGPREQAAGAVFVPLRQNDIVEQATFYVRTTRPSAGIFDALRAAVHGFDPGLAVFDERTLDTQLDDALYIERLIAVLSIAFAALATLLAALGLYGVIAFSVARRTREIGIRMALGAARASVLRMVLTEVAWLTAFGVAAGAAAALGLGRFVASLLFGMKPEDPAALALSIAGLLAVALLAGLFPAWRAARINPASALHSD
jgi:predicted permease